MAEKEMLGKKIWAVVGVSQNPEKYGYKIYKKLKLRGYQAYAINPMYQDIEGDPCYKDLSSLPVKPEVINVVVSPERAVKVLEEAAALGIKDIWFQPGTHTEETLELAGKLGLNYVTACALVATR